MLSHPMLEKECTSPTIINNIIIIIDFVISVYFIDIWLL